MLGEALLAALGDIDERARLVVAQFLRGTPASLRHSLQMRGTSWTIHHGSNPHPAAGDLVSPVDNFWALRCRFGRVLA